jgi:hypothetical protein
MFWISSGLLSALMLLSASMYLFNHEEVSKNFIKLGYPTYIIYPLAIAKLLGIITILYRKCKTLTEWAYAGFSFNFTLAFFAHIMIGDGQEMGAIIALLLLCSSYFFYKKTFFTQE